MGAKVLGVDASQANIDVAKHHAFHQQFKHGSLMYECTTAGTPLPMKNFIGIYLC
ncbi:hypothetical protein HMI55_000971 [Coelomomyces lativittatus]|nr:hypothetical protein HMI55_000971 [Coelomomyces lativittatus]